MADYTAGNLDLNLRTIGNNTISVLDTVIARLKTINSLLSATTKGTFGGNLANIGVGGVKAPSAKPTAPKKSTPKSSPTAGGGLNSFTRGIYEFDDAGNIHSKLVRITVKSTDSTRKFGKAMDSTRKSAGNYGGTLKGLNKIFGGLKLGFTFHWARRIGSLLAKVVQYGSDFDETLNMWQVSMRNSLDLADDFINKMHKAYGISTETLMRNQAVYKNMLSQMGQLTEETSYQLSESLTRMMLDYSSLWNTSIESASQKFQAMLAGQIRPIRSISGISVEEQAIFDIYKSMGGAKTMRQLTQVEKRLLRIYATFSQMEQSGATMGQGDFAKTMENFANQSRLMGEYWKELVTWVGLGAKHFIETSGIMQKINAALIVLTEIIKAVVKSSGYEQKNFLDGIFESAEETNKEVDDLQDKLLGFDQFRSMDEGENNSNVAIDEKVLELLSGYSSSLEGVENTAQKLAEEWLPQWVDSSGKLTDNAQRLFDTLKELPTLLITIGGTLAFTTLAKGIGDVSTAVSGLSGALTLLSDNPVIAIIGLVLSLLTALYFTNEDFKVSIDTLFASLTPLFEALLPIVTVLIELLNKILPPLVSIITSAVNLVMPIINWVFAVVTPALSGVIDLVAGLTMGIIDLVGGILGFFADITKGWDTAWHTLANSFASMINAVSNGFISFVNNMVNMLNTLVDGINILYTWTGAPAIPHIPQWDASVNWMPYPEQYANGGMPDVGTLFIAGEAGAEIVSTSSSGQTGVSNVQQIAQATYQGTMSALRDWWGGQNARGDIPQLAEANATGMYQAVTGVAKSYGKTWSNV